jgi:hypothetical protein
MKTEYTKQLLLTTDEKETLKRCIKNEMISLEESYYSLTESDDDRKRNNDQYETLAVILNELS